MTPSNNRRKMQSGNIQTNTNQDLALRSKVKFSLERSPHLVSLQSLAKDIQQNYGRKWIQGLVGRTQENFLMRVLDFFSRSSLLRLFHLFASLKFLLILTNYRQNPELRYTELMIIYSHFPTSSRIGHLFT